MRAGSAAGLRCPHCGSRNTRVPRSPREVEDVVMRRHDCRDCGRRFLSAQVVLDDGALSEELAGLIS